MTVQDPAQSAPVTSGEGAELCAGTVGPVGVLMQSIAQISQASWAGSSGVPVKSSCTQA